MRSFVILVAMLWAGFAWAAPSGGYGNQRASSGTAEIAAAEGLINVGRYQDAIVTLELVVNRSPKNADALNLLGYSHRKIGDFAKSRNYYTRALLADPEHDGALAYMAELEIHEGNLDAARALQARLQRVCPNGCDALAELNAAFAASGVS